MPAQPHRTMAETGAMGLHHQQTALSLVQWNISLEDDAHALAAERKKLHRDGVLIQLQPALLRIVRGPELHLAAST